MTMTMMAAFEPCAFQSCQASISQQRTCVPKFFNPDVDGNQQHYPHHHNHNNNQIDPSESVEFEAGTYKLNCNSICLKYIPPHGEMRDIEKQQLYYPAKGQPACLVPAVSNTAPVVLFRRRFNLDIHREMIMGVSAV